MDIYSDDGTVLQNVPSGTVFFIINASCLRIRGENNNDYAFYLCKETIQSCTFEENSQLEIISPYSFYQCDKLTEIDLSVCPKLTTISQFAFDSCASLISVKFPESLQEIGNFAFGRTLIQSIVIPKSVNSLYSTCFFGCKYLKEIVIDPENSHYTSEGYAVLSKDFSQLVLFTSYMTGNYEIPSTVVHIAQFCFSFSSLSYITLPDSITTLGAYCFSHSLIHSINLSSSINTIPACCFSHCYNLQIIDIPDGVQTIGERAFEYCINLNLVFLPTTIMKIGGGPFAGCSSFLNITFKSDHLKIIDMCLLVDEQLKSIISCIFDIESIIIPSTIENINESAFYSMKSLKNVTFEEPSQLKTIGESAFHYCDSIKNIELPESLISIGHQAFRRCYSLEFIVIPSNCTYIGDYALADCQNLQKCIISSNLIDIHPYLFYQCYKLNYIELPSTIQVIHPYSFYDTGIIGFTIPENTISIGRQAFADCRNLVHFHIGLNLNSIGINALANCISLELITVNEKNTDLCIYNQALMDRKMSHLICFPPSCNINFFGIPPTTEIILPYAFAYSKSLQVIYIPENSVKYINYGAFSNCKSLQTITIPSSVTEVGEDAFYGCNNLQCGLPIQNRDHEFLQLLINKGKLPQRCIASCQQYCTCRNNNPYYRGFLIM